MDRIPPSEGGDACSIRAEGTDKKPDISEFFVFSPSLTPPY